MSRIFQIFLIAQISFVSLVFGQNNGFDDKLFAGYDLYKEQSLSVRRIKWEQLQPLIDNLKNVEGFKVTHLGKSIEGRDISMISIGSGDVDVLLWSQMHGNEPTATMAIFDILNYLESTAGRTKETRVLMDNLRIHFIPMLNPDGADKFKRRNALNIDVNRDALRLQSPEGQLLKRVRDSLNADFGFNLHDQSIYYNVERTEKPATISYLATAYNYDKSINEVRKRSMQVIAMMNNIVQKYAPGQVGRYSDDFEPRAFGDNIQKWGTSLVLIESGGYKNDTEKQFIRKLNFISILSGLYSIANNSYTQFNPGEYDKIPLNDRKLFDLKIENMNYRLNGKNYIIDVGINLNEVDNKAHTSYHYVGVIEEIGDLSTYYGYTTLDASGMDYAPGKLYAEVIDYTSLPMVPFDKILNKGITTASVHAIPDSLTYSEYPLNLVNEEQEQKNNFGLGQNATFVLMSDEEVKYVILNGFVYAPGGKIKPVHNGIINK